MKVGKLRWTIIALFVGAMVIFAIAPLVLTVLGYDPVTFVLNAVGKDATLTGRTEIWEVAGEVIGEHPGIASVIISRLSAGV